MTIVNSITHLFRRIDDKLTHHQQNQLHNLSNLYSSEVATIVLLFALNGLSDRAFYRWIANKYKPLFPIFLNKSAFSTYLTVINISLMSSWQILHSSASLFDVFTRTIRGWELSKNMSVNLLYGALRKALARQHRPQIHHSDRGGQYIAEKYCQQLRAIACRISMTDRGKPWQNPYVESTIGRIKDEYIVDSEYQNFHDAYNQLSLVLDVVYNQKRPHSALGYRTPAEFEAAYNAH